MKSLLAAPSLSDIHPPVGIKPTVLIEGEDKLARVALFVQLILSSQHA